MKGGPSDEESRKRIEELITRYELNPDIRDVYVEGEWDKRLIGWLLGMAGFRDIVVYDIDGVHIPADLLSKYNLPEGKKGRVVALAHELEDHVEDIRQVTCIADRDYDTLLGCHHSSKLLLHTDYACQEMYFLNETTVGKFLKLVVGTCPIGPTNLISNLLGLLQELHLYRAANISLQWGMNWLDPGKCCKVAGGALILDSEGFLTKYLNKNARLKHKQQFLSALDDLKSKLTADPRMHASKDDLFDLLSVLLPRYCKEQSLHQPGYIARSLAGCAEGSELLRYPLYGSLISRLKG